MSGSCQKPQESQNTPEKSTSPGNVNKKARKSVKQTFPETSLQFMKRQSMLANRSPFPANLKIAGKGCSVLKGRGRSCHRLLFPLLAFQLLQPAFYNWKLTANEDGTCGQSYRYDTRQYDFAVKRESAPKRIMYCAWNLRNIRYCNHDEDSRYRKSDFFFEVFLL